MSPENAAILKFSKLIDNISLRNNMTYNFKRENLTNLFQHQLQQLYFLQSTLHQLFPLLNQNQLFPHFLLLSSHQFSLWFEFLTTEYNFQINANVAWRCQIQTRCFMVNKDAFKRASWSTLIIFVFRKLPSLIFNMRDLGLNSDSLWAAFTNAGSNSEHIWGLPQGKPRHKFWPNHHGIIIYCDDPKWDVPVYSQKEPSICFKV